MVRTQSIISVSEELGGTGSPGGSISKLGGQDTNEIRKEGVGRKLRSQQRRQRLTKSLKNCPTISGSSQEETGGKDMLDRIERSRMNDNGVANERCSPHRVVNRGTAANSNYGKGLGNDNKILNPTEKYYMQHK